MKKFSEAVLAPHKHMSKKASPYHAHSQGLVYTPSGKTEVRPIDTADAGYGGEAVTDAEGGEADAGKASKKAVSPMKMQTLVKKTNEETERERLMKLRSFAAKNKKEGLGKAMVEEEQIDELKKSTLASYAKKAADEVSYHSFTAGTMSPKDPERLETDKKAMKRQRGVEKAVDKLAKEEVELDEISQEARKNKMRTMGVNAAIQHPKKVDFAGGAIQMYRQAVKKLSSREMSDVAKKLPSVKEQNDWNGPEEENDMAMTQLHFIKYAAEKIMAAIEVGTDMEEWYQNKLSKLHSDMESLYSYMQGTTRYHGSLGDPVSEGKMKDIATDKAEAERILGGPVKPKSSVVGGKGQPKNLRNLTTRLAARAMKAGGSVSEEVWDKPMPDSKKQGSLSPEQKAKAKARAERAGRSYPNMIDNMWASKQ